MFFNVWLSVLKASSAIIRIQIFTLAIIAKITTVLNAATVIVLNVNRHFSTLNTIVLNRVQKKLMQNLCPINVYHVLREKKMQQTARNVQVQLTMIANNAQVIIC